MKNDPKITIMDLKLKLTPANSNHFPARSSEIHRADSGITLADPGRPGRKSRAWNAGQNLMESGFFSPWRSKSKFA